MKVTIEGMKASKGTMDNGQSFDSTKVYVKTRLDDSKGMMKGFSTTEYGFGDSTNFEKYKHLPFPFLAEIEYDEVTNGKTTKRIVVSLQPLEVNKPAQGAQRAAA